MGQDATLVLAELMRARLQQCEQSLAPQAAEAVSAAEEGAAAKVDRDVVPMMELPGDRRMRRGIGAAEVLDSPIGEHDAPAEGVIRPIALEYIDPGVWQRFTQQDGGVQSSRPAADTDDSFHGGLPRLQAVSHSPRVCVIFQNA